MINGLERKIRFFHRNAYIYYLAGKELNLNTSRMWVSAHHKKSEFSYRTERLRRALTQKPPTSSLLLFTDKIIMVCIRIAISALLGAGREAEAVDTVKTLKRIPKSLMCVAIAYDARELFLYLLDKKVVPPHDCIRQVVASQKMKMAKVLLERGFTRDMKGRNGLMLSARHKNMGAARMFLKLNDINARDKSGQTALIHASRYWRGLWMCRFLLKNGADDTLRDHEGNSFTSLMSQDKEDKRAIKLLKSVTSWRARKELKSACKFEGSSFLERHGDVLIVVASFL